MLDKSQYTGQVVNYGDKVVEPANPTMEGAIFKKWVDKDWQDFDFENTEIKKYTELYAIFNGTGGSTDAILLS